MMKYHESRERSRMVVILLSYNLLDVSRIDNLVEPRIYNVRISNIHGETFCGDSLSHHERSRDDTLVPQREI